MRLNMTPDDRKTFKLMPIQKSLGGSTKYDCKITSSPNGFHHWETAFKALMTDQHVKKY